ncbi:MAG: GNAT family N-acetyltransferase [Burkholderiaceae bacterium]|jgi:RimJ/RimL family protein N-acetyltransferase|nr:GNAT family N-acetyltransferase [Burkholderiaceae bacterium]
MLPASDVLKTAFTTGILPKALVSSGQAGTRQSVLVPIRSLGSGERECILRHLLELDAHDRYLRFGCAASDEQVCRYVNSIDFERDEVFGIYNRRLELIAMAHVAFAPAAQHNDGAEFGVSVAKFARGRGYGALLFERAQIAARNQGVHMLFIHALSENAAMLKIARNAGAAVQRSGSESEAHLDLPESTKDSLMSRVALDQLAEMDYQIKVQARQFWDLLTELQKQRADMRDENTV